MLASCAIETGALRSRLAHADDAAAADVDAGGADAQRAYRGGPGSRAS